MTDEKRIALRATPESRQKPRKSLVQKSATSESTASATAEEANPSTRERILISATRFFAEQGFASTSMPAIAKASGVTAGAIYKHFKSKADLLFEVTRRALISIPLFVQAAQRETNTGTLTSLAAIYTQPELKLLRQLSIEVHSAATKDTKVKRAVAVSNEQAIAGTSAIIAAAQREGRIDPNLNPTSLAYAFTIFIMGLTHMETLAPHLVGDPEWRAFVSDRVAALIGLGPTS
jgi:AcrR family transcriptional regulator